MEKKEKILSISVLCVFALYIICSILINTKGLYLFFESDMYADLVLSKYIWNQKTLFPDGWVFGNQYYVISTPVLMALLNGIFDNAFVSLKVATAIMMVLIFISYYWMLRPFAKKISIYVGLLLIIASLIGCEIGKQLEGQIFYLGASYYSSYLITLLLTCGCYLRIANNINNSKYMILLTALLSFACGMQSLRQTVVMVLPLIICSVIINNRKSIKYSLLILVVNIFGIVTIKTINPQNVSIYGSSEIVNPKEWTSRVLGCLDSLKKITGIRWILKGNPIGLFGILLVFIVIIVVYNSFKERKDYQLFPAIILFIFGILGVCAACTFTNTNIRYIYLFPWYALVAISGTQLIEIIINRKLNDIVLFSSISIFIFLSLCNLYVSYGNEIHDSIINKETVEKEVGEYIITNNYKYVYGEWVKLGKFMPYMNDEVLGGSWIGEPFQIIGYLNPLDIYNEDNNNKAVYLLYDEEVESALKSAQKRDIQLNKIVEFNNGEIQLFVSNKQLMYFKK